ncbi:hypothetical protein [Luteolibacter marinus]|uniref:hypothetical protein n=1 Tax=Luteolibacter marinus TaxID=2776705 RepID=UPI001866E77F|nr:hypothetical protein [Luteolibacter marinus]
MSESVSEHAVVEGLRYAKEVEAQSPFETVEMSWSEADKLMQERNRDYIVAKTAYQQAVEERPVVRNLTDEVKNAVSFSLGDVLKPQELLKTLNEPVTQLPKQLASIGKLKDLSHNIEGSAWKHTAESVDAELKMRGEKVKLQQLLRTGELIDAEMAKLDAAPPLPADADPKLSKALQGWRGVLRDERRKWLGEVRDFFDAEYRDVRFVKDGSGLPNYRDANRPDLTEWDRWGWLQRSKELVAALRKAHDASKPALPGTRAVTETLADMVHPGDKEPEPVLKTEAVRSEVRTLIQHWREMKLAQEQALGLEAQEDPSSFDSIARVDKRQAIFKLRQQEIQHSVVIWMMDEQCWQ